MKDEPAAQAEHFRTEHLQADLRGRAVRGGAVTLATQVGKFAVQLGSTVILARLLTPDDYGLVGMVTAITGFLALFKDLGLSAATVQRAELSQAQVSALFWINVAFSIVLVLVAAAAAHAVAAFYGEPRLAGITLLLSTGFLFSGLAVQHQALLKRQMRFGALSGIDLGSLAAGAGVGIATAALGFGYWSLVAMQLTVFAATAIGSWTLCGWRPGAPARGAEIGAMLAMGGNITAFQAINYWVKNLDNILIGRVWGAQQLGLYARAYQLLLLPLSQINAPMAAVAVPTLSRLVDSPDRYRQAYLRMLETIVFLTMPLAAFTIATADWLVAVALGPQWGGAAAIFAWLGITAFTQPISYTTGCLFITQGRTREMLLSELITGAVAIAAIVAGLRWGALGVAAWFAVAEITLRAPILFWFVGRSGPIRTRDILRAVAPFFLAALAALGGLLAFRYFVEGVSPVVGLCAAALLTALLALAVLFALPAGRRSLRESLGLIRELAARRRGAS